METRNWYSWINYMPPKPDDFHVTGEVYVGSPGIKAELLESTSQGTNPNILLLDLHLVQLPGMWPQVLTWVPCRLDRIQTPSSPSYTDVTIFHNGIQVANMAVDSVS